MWRRLKRLLARLWQEHTSPARLGLAVGVGVLIGCSPFYGLHFWIGLAVAMILRMNKVAIFLGAQISIPPLAPLIVYACVQLGSLFLRGEPLTITLDDLSGMGFVELAQTFFVDWLAGWPVVGASLGAPIGLLFALWARWRRARGGEAPDLEAEADAAWDARLDRLAERFGRAPPRHRHYVFFKARMDPAYRLVCELLADARRVVDLGAGQGVLPILLALRDRPEPHRPPAPRSALRAPRSFTGVEWDAGKVAAGRLAAEGLQAVRLEEGDVREYAIDEADAVVLMDVLHYYPLAAQRRLVQRAADALVTGGRLVIRETDRDGRSALTRLLEWVAVKVKMNRGPGLCYRTAAELRRELAGVGLKHQEAPASSSVHKGNILIWGEKT